MNIDELLKQQAEWAEKVKDLTQDIIRRRTGTTPEEAGLGEMEGVQERVKALEARRAAMLKAFDTAIEMERRAGEPASPGGVRTPIRPVGASAKPAQTAPKHRKGGR